MNDTVTFFRNRTEDNGKTYRFDITTEKAASRYFVYCRQAISSKEFADRHLGSKDVKPVRDRLEQLIANGGGGIIVGSTLEGPSATVEVMVIGSEVPAAQNFLVLSPGRPAYLLPVSKKKTIPAASHLLVPVDEGAERRLTDFTGHLAWFSYDLEALLLDAIRKPSLDTRLEDVETVVFGETNEDARRKASARSWKGVTRRIAHAMTSPVAFMVVFGALLILLLMMNVSKMNGIEAQLASLISKPADSKPTPGEKKPLSSNPAAASQSQSPEVAVEMRSLLKEMKKTTNADVRELYTAYLQPFDADAPESTTIAAWFAGTPVVDKKARNPLLLGIVKLQALRLHAADIGHGSNDFTGAAKAFQVIGPAALQKDRTAQRMIGALACRMWDPPKAVLKTFDRGATPELKVTDDNCGALTDADIANGLHQLVEYVRNDAH